MSCHVTSVPQRNRSTTASNIKQHAASITWPSPRSFWSNLNAILRWRTKNESQDWWQGFLCRWTQCLKSAADRLETLCVRLRHSRTNWRVFCFILHAYSYTEKEPQCWEHCVNSGMRDCKSMLLQFAASLKNGPIASTFYGRILRHTCSCLSDMLGLICVNAITFAEIILRIKLCARRAHEPPRCSCEKQVTDDQGVNWDNKVVV